MIPDTGSERVQEGPPRARARRRKLIGERHAVGQGVQVDHLVAAGLQCCLDVCLGLQERIRRAESVGVGRGRPLSLVQE